MFTGCGTALVTPFRRDGSLDEAALRRLVRRQFETEQRADHEDTQKGEADAVPDSVDFHGVVSRKMAEGGSLRTHGIRRMSRRRGCVSSG